VVLSKKWIKQYDWHFCMLFFFQLMQYYYQSGCLYRLRALGERHDMDITVGKLLLQFRLSTPPSCNEIMVRSCPLSIKDVRPVLTFCGQEGVLQIQFFALLCVRLLWTVTYAFNKIWNLTFWVFPIYLNAKK